MPTTSAPAASTATCRPGLTDRRSREWVDGFPKFVDELEDLLTSNRIWKQRTVDIGIMTPEDALAWGFTGPPLRASGIAWDLRRAQPYEVYEELEFDIPVGRNGDCYDRYLVRIAPRCGRARPHHQAVPAAPCRPGPCDPGQQVHAAAPDGDEALDGSADPPLQAIHRGVPCPRRVDLHARPRAPKGEFGVYLVADGSNRAYRCKIRPTGYAHPASDRATCPKRPHAGRRGRDHRLARPRVRRDRQVEMANREDIEAGSAALHPEDIGVNPPADHPASRRASPSTPTASGNRGHPQEYPPEPEGERGHSAALCRAEADGA